MSDKEKERDAILKELHQSDSEPSEDDDDADLGLELAKAKASKQSNEKKKEDPIDEEQKRHKENLMQDLYDAISDEDEEEPKTQDAGDNPFKQQMI